MNGKMNKEEQFKKYQKENEKLLFGYAMKICRDRELAEDVLSESYLKAWAAFDSYDSNKKFATWMCTIIKNTFVDFNRGRKQEIKSAVFLDDLNIADGNSSLDFVSELSSGETPEDVYNKKEAVKDCLALLDKIPVDQKEVLLLLSAGHSYEKIAELTHSEVCTVRSRIFRARKSMSAFAGEYFASAG